VETPLQSTVPEQWWMEEMRRMRERLVLLEGERAREVQGDGRTSAGASTSDRTTDNATVSEPPPIYEE
jgi:predicted ATPase